MPEQRAWGHGLATVAEAARPVASTSAVRKYNSKPGGTLNIEQEITSDAGVFARLSANNGTTESYEFTEINNSISAGVSLKGARWDRPNDTFGLAFVNNGISDAARSYFAAGGLGILIGDGQLPRKGTENILETYYRATVSKGISLSFDYQFIANPAYDAARGPVHILGLRFHAEL